MKKHSIDFNGEHFPSYNRAVIMAGISEKQNERVFAQLIPMSGVKSLARLDSWNVEKNEEGYPIIRFQSGKERDLTFLIKKGKDLEPYDIRNASFKTIIKVAMSAPRKFFRDVLYNASPKREPDATCRKMVNFVYDIEPYNISCLEALMCAMDVLPYKTTLVYVIPDIAVLKEENEKARRVYKSGTLKERIRKSIETLQVLKNREDIVQFFDEIWVVLANSRTENEPLDYIRFTEIYKVKGSDESVIKLDEEIVSVLRKQLEVCDDVVEWMETAAIKVFGGRYTTAD